MPREKQHKENLHTVSNYLTFYRFLSAPVILYLIFSGRPTLFMVFIILNLISDALDGFFARKLNQHTDFGAKMDSIADKVTYALAIIGLFAFKMEEMQPYLGSLLTFVGLGVIALTHSFIKFGKISSLHTYATKAGGYMQGIFFFVLFTYGFVPTLYYIMITWAILSVLEMIAMQIMITEMKPNLKGLYWLLRDGKT